jgi:regulator of PEP synthase PpsR (kinase-PPPase family)
MAKRKPSARPRKSRTGPAAPAPRRPATVHLVSDSTGNLARHMLAAFVTQFPDNTFVIRAWNFINTPEKLSAVFGAIATEPGLVLHAVVDPQHKAAIARQCGRLGVECHDLTGGFVELLSRAAGVEPQPDAARLHSTGREYHRRIEALEFTLQHDDGLGVDSLSDAQIVLAGVSRTSKTPTSIYLAQLGYRTANVSLALGIDPPAPLLALKTHVVGLIIQPTRLAEIRTTRQIGWRMGNTSYNDPERVAEEVTWSRRLFARQGWPILDVTHRAVEETAARIVELLKLT